MKVFKYCCAMLALAYLVGAALPYTQPSGAPQTAPVWVGRAALAMNALLFCVMFLGMQSRRPVFWRLIPVLMTMFLLINTIGPIWSMIQLSQPWLPFLSVVIFIVIGLLVFMVWWRRQKSYFEARSRG